MVGCLGLGRDWGEDVCLLYCCGERFSFALFADNMKSGVLRESIGVGSVLVRAGVSVCFKGIEAELVSLGLCIRQLLLYLLKVGCFHGPGSCVHPDRTYDLAPCLLTTNSATSEDSRSIRIPTLSLFNFNPTSIITTLNILAMSWATSRPSYPLKYEDDQPASDCPPPPPTSGKATIRRT